MNAICTCFFWETSLKINNWKEAVISNYSSATNTQLWVSVMHYLPSQPQQIVLKALKYLHMHNPEDIFFSEVEKTIQSAILLSHQPLKSFSQDCPHAASRSNFPLVSKRPSRIQTQLGLKGVPEGILQAPAGRKRPVRPSLPATGLEGTASLLRCPRASCRFCHKRLCEVHPSTPGACPCKSVPGDLNFWSRSWHIHKKSHWAEPQKATSSEPPMNSEWSGQGHRKSGNCGLWGRFSWDSHSSLWRASKTCYSERIPGSVTPKQERTGKPAHTPHSQCCRDT